MNHLWQWIETWKAEHTGLAIPETIRYLLDQQLACLVMGAATAGMTSAVSDIAAVKRHVKAARRSAILQQLVIQRAVTDIIIQQAERVWGVSALVKRHSTKRLPLNRREAPATIEGSLELDVESAEPEIQAPNEENAKLDYQRFSAASQARTADYAGVAQKAVQTTTQTPSPGYVKFARKTIGTASQTPRARYMTLARKTIPEPSTENAKPATQTKSIPRESAISFGADASELASEVSDDAKSFASSTNGEERMEPYGVDPQADEVSTSDAVLPSIEEDAEKEPGLDHECIAADVRYSTSRRHDEPSPTDCWEQRSLSVLLRLRCQSEQGSN